jgi:sorbose reductase
VVKLSEQLSIAGKKLIITGGARGIGKTVAGMLVEEGAEAALVDINADMARAAAAELSAKYAGRCVGIYCDVAQPESVAAMMREYIAQFGRLDGVFNNAGIAGHGPAIETAPEDWRKIIDVNLSGVYYVAQAAARQFVAQGGKGSIVNTASMSGTIVNVPQKQAAYNASKAAVVHLTKSLAVEWAEYGIRVNSISPGYILTEMTASVRRDWVEEWLHMIPFRRMGSPEELAGAVLYLLSDAASYTSGADLIIDGCFTCV